MFIRFGVQRRMFGPVAERLGSGLQNRLHRFDSGRGLEVDGLKWMDRDLSPSSTRFIIEGVATTLVATFWGMAKW